jgi:hypothetical protein
MNGPRRSEGVRRRPDELRPGASDSLDVQRLGKVIVRAVRKDHRPPAEDRPPLVGCLAVLVKEITNEAINHHSLLERLESHR